MKKISILLSALFLFALMPAYSSAQVARFEVSMGMGRNNPKPEVMRLQQFLFDKGYLKVAPTGNYLSLTTEAVRAFQRSQGIEATGFFGPLTMAALNRVSGRVASEVSGFSVASVKGLASVFSSEMREIKWETKNYPSNAGVNINLIRKISDDPVEYVFVRHIAKDTQNDGYEIWIPDSQDGDRNSLYIEVTCSTAYSFEGECRFSGKAVKVY